MLLRVTDELGRLVPVDPREVWPSEAHHFTPWLLENADVLAQVLGIDIELTANEHPVGSFALDLIGRDLSNDCVLVVENQLTVTDHSHLGQIVTYSAGTDAATIVWIATSFREEHRQSLDWLNQVAEGNARFFGVEVGAVRIASSPPAPLFTLRAQPNDWHSQVASTARVTSQASGKGLYYVQFWTRFLERVRVEHPGWTNSRTPGSDNWISMPSPLKGGPTYGVSFAWKGRLRSEFYIDFTDPTEVERVYQFLLDHRDEIEAAYGGPLSWEELPNNRASKVADYGEGDVANTDRHDKYIDWMFDTNARLRAAINPIIAGL